MGRPPVLALTATAAPPVRAEAVLFYRPEDSGCGGSSPVAEGRAQTMCRCLAGVDDESGPADEPFPVHGQVSHQAWGRGQVMGYEGDTVTVFFDTVGYKTLSVELVQAGDLLVPEG